MAWTVIETDKLKTMERELKFKATTIMAQKDLIRHLKYKIKTAYYDT